MLILAILAGLLVEPDTSRRPGTAQEPASVVVLREPALPVVALRLAIVADDPPGYAGAGHLVQHLHLAALQERTARVGGRVQALRTSDAVVYTVVGPSSELDHLADALRATLLPPAPSTTDLLLALRALEQERTLEREVAPAYVRAALRAQLFPGDLSGAGTAAGARRLATARLADVWAALYAPERVSVVAVGDVELARVRDAFSHLPAAPPAALAERTDTVRPLAADTPQASRAWLGRAWALEDADPAAMTVTARLLRDHLRERMTRSEVEVEHWWTHHGHALALVVATPDSLARVARRTVDGALAGLRGNLDAARVRGASASLRREMLFFARTPARMADLLGGFVERGDGGDGAQRFFSALEDVTESSVRGTIDALEAASRAALEVPAQRPRP
jgi:predicted Zn-dependent peptidase